jgi:hypothetical protein
MSKLINGTYTMGMPFSNGSQTISTDNVIESDSNITLSSVINTIQAGTFDGNLTMGNASGDSITINAGTTQYVNNEAITIKDNSTSSLSISSTGNTNMMILDTTDGNEKITLNRKLALVNTTAGATLLTVQTNQGTWNLENYLGAEQLRPSADATLIVSSANNLNNCLTLQPYNTAPSIDIMNVSNSIVRIGDSANSASSVMEIFGVKPTIKSSVY